MKISDIVKKHLVEDAPAGQIDPAQDPKVKALDAQIAQLQQQREFVVAKITAANANAAKNAANTAKVQPTTNTNASQSTGGSLN